MKNGDSNYDDGEPIQDIWGVRQKEKTGARIELGRDSPNCGFVSGASIEDRERQAPESGMVYDIADREGVEVKEGRTLQGLDREPSWSWWVRFSHGQECPELELSKAGRGCLQCSSKGTWYKGCPLLYSSRHILNKHCLCTYNKSRRCLRVSALTPRSVMV